MRDVPHAREDRFAAAAVDQTRLPVRKILWRALRERYASGAAVSGSAAKTFAFLPRSFIAAAIPHDRPPPPNQATTASTSGRSSRISRPAEALPAMNSSSSNGCTNAPGHRRMRAGFERLPAFDRRWPARFLRRGGGPHRAWLRGRVHDEHFAGNAGLLRGERDSLGGVAGADGPDSAAALLFRQKADGVVCAANLERADGLQAFQLQIDFGRAVVVQAN